MIGYFTHFMQRLLPHLPSGETLAAWGWGGAVTILAVLAIRYLFRTKLSPRWRYALWLVVLVRLLIPVSLFESGVGIPTQALPMDTMLYALPTQVYEHPEGEKLDTPTLDRTEMGYPNGMEYYAGGVVMEGDRTTDYAFMMPLSELLVSLWCIGAGVMLLVLGWNLLLLRVRLRDDRKPLPAEDCPIPIYTVEGLPSPFLLGPLRPAIYLTPEDAADPVRLRHILAHELTHYAQRDHIWAVARCLCLALHWYDPLVWLAVKLSREDCELSCDAGTVGRLGEEERISYGRTLVDMVARNSREPLLSCSTAMTGQEKPIRRRVTALVRSPETGKTALFLALSLAAVAGVLSFGGAQKPLTDFERFQAAMDDLFYVQYIRPAVSSQAGPCYIQEEAELTSARRLLQETARPLTEEEKEGLFHYSSTLRLQPVLVTASDADTLEQYSMVSDDGETYIVFRSDGTDMVPVAALPKEVVPGIGLSCATAWADCRIQLLTTYLTAGQSYRFTGEEEEFDRLTRFLLDHPEVLEANPFPREGLAEKWLTEWTDSYQVWYGRPFPYPIQDEACWSVYASASGSNYTFVIPDQLTEELLAICEGA